MAFTARTETFARGSSLASPYDFTINKAGGVVDGDIMFMFLAVYFSPTPPTIDSVPSGWQQVATNIAGNARWYLYYKIASSEGASYTWSLTASTRYYALNIAYSSGDFSVAGLGDITVSNTLYGTFDAIVRAASMNVPDANSPLVYFGAVYSTASKTFTKPSVPTSDWVEDADEGHTTPDLWVTNGSMIWAGSGATGNMDIICSASITTYKHAFAVALKPNVVSAVGDTVQPLWHVRVAAGDTVRPVFNIRAAIGDTVGAVFHIRQAVGDTVRPLWNVRATAFKAVQSIWNVRQVVGDNLQAIWNVLVNAQAVGDVVQLVWKVRQVVGDTANAKWNVLAAIGKTMQAVFNIRAAVGKSTSVVWHVRQAIGDTTQLIWNVLGGAYYGVLKRWTGSAWGRATLKVFTGGSWQNKPLNVWNGTEWKQVDTTG